MARQLNFLGEPEGKAKDASNSGKDSRTGSRKNSGEDSGKHLPVTFIDLADARARALECRACGLCQSRNHVVFSDGNPEAKLMIIGEAPGNHEDLSGTPFVGRAGQLLTKILESADIDRRRDTYICNVIKCRPPGNRVPTPEEAASCRPYLEAQIAFIKPRLILLAGATAVQHVLKIKDPISKIRGKWFEHASGARIMPVFHPSYLLRNDSREPGSPKWHMWQDIKEVKRCLDLLD